LKKNPQNKISSIGYAKQPVMTNIK